jgi:hypothetical protein
MRHLTNVVKLSCLSQKRGADVFLQGAKPVTCTFKASHQGFGVRKATTRNKDDKQLFLLLPAFVSSYSRAHYTSNLNFSF